MAVDYTPSFDPADVDSDYGSTGGDITVPTFTANMKPFRFWCQRALPLVYDDSLSYYEVLCKVVDQMNGFLTDLQTATGSIAEFAQQFVVNQQFLNQMAAKLGQDVDTLETYINDRMDDFTAAYQQLQSYVNNYFDNLDVQQEINNKLDEMAQDGTFNTLFDPVITAWMTAKTAQIDSAIANQDAIQAQQNGRISVLESRMDGFSSLPAGSTSGNAELLDIRTNFLGEVYPSAGDAVRASDMIVSGFQSIGFTRLTEWNGNSESSVYDTIVFDVAAYKGGHVAVIANMENFAQSIQDGIGIGLYGSNVAGKTVDDNAMQYPFPDGYSGITGPVFKNYSVISTAIQGEERILLQLSIPTAFPFQYLKLGNVEFIPQTTHTTPEAIVYASSWSKTPVDATLSIAGDAADAKATGDAIGAVNERLENEENITKALVITTQNGNIADIATDELEGKYYYRGDDNLLHSIGSESYNCFIVKVIPNSTYTASDNVKVVLLDSSRDPINANGQGWDYNGVSTFETSTAVLAAISYPASASNFALSEGDTASTGAYSESYNIDDSNYVLKNGMEQVTPQNIEGMTKTNEKVKSVNLFPKASLVAEGKYIGGITQATGKVFFYDSASYNTYIIPVDGESTYTFTFARFAVLTSDTNRTAVGSVLENQTVISSEGANYIMFSFNPSTYDPDDYEITKPVDVYIIPPNWAIEETTNNIEKVSGSIADSASMAIVGGTALKDGELIVFKGLLSTIGGFTLNFTGATQNYNYIKLDVTQSETTDTISIKSDNNTPTPADLGFKLTNDVTITVQFSKGNANITVYSGGNSYSISKVWYPTGAAMTRPKITSEGAVFSDATLLVTYECVKRSIWYFGDSYITISTERWPYYLDADSYFENALFNGASGGNSASAAAALNVLLKYGTPKIAVFATGMNDGSDTNSETPTNLWKNNRDAFLSACENNGITPVFATVPTVPTVNNEAKNAWVRASGYRYIDFASAVGASSSGVWYPGMLSNDGIHPSVKGAKALYTQVLIDLPEITAT